MGLLSPNVPLETQTMTPGPVTAAKVQRPKSAVEGKRRMLRATTATAVKKLHQSYN